MSRLCRLKTASHGDDGKWAYGEIVSLRKQRDELLAALEGIQLKIPGGRGTDKWESSRVADFNEGWNAYRKAAREVIYAAIDSAKGEQ